MVIMKYFAITIDLNQELEKHAKEAWRLLEEKFSIQFISKHSPCPHIAIENGLYGDKIKVLEIIQEVASQTPPFTIKGNKLGVFVGQTPVIHIRWMNNNSLIDLRKKFGEAFNKQCQIPDSTISGYKENPDWLPKTTLAYKDSSYENLSNVLKLLQPLPFDSKLEVRQLTLYEYSEGNPEKQLNNVTLSG
jgi:2'-5' RNA ligase